MTDSEPIAWLNGEWMPFSEAKLPLFDSGIAHGDAVAEMLRTFGHKPFRVEGHLARLRHSLQTVAIESPMKDEDWTRLINECVHHNANLIPDFSDLGIILFVTSGPNLTYLGSDSGIESSITACVHTFPLPFDLWHEKYTSGINLVVADTPSIPEASWNPTAKVRSRIHWRIADRKVKQNHPSSTAIFATADGHLTETSSGNLFALIEGTVVTPPANSVLSGISRQVVLEIAEKEGLRAEQRNITIEEACEAEELWISSTPSCLLPVSSLNERRIGAQVPGPTYRRILDEWSAMVGVDITNQR